MSTTPSPLANFNPKSFWKKPEGVPGMILMGLLLGLGGWGLYIALPFIITLLTNVIYTAALVGVIAALAYIVMNGTVQTLAKNIFQSICRGIATCYTTIDPIGILKNQLDDMKKAKRELDDTIQRFAGSDNSLRTNIAKKQQEIAQLKAQSQAADRMLASKSDPLERERIKLQGETYLEKAGLLMQAVAQLQALEDQTADMLGKFRHWSQVSDAKIDRTAMRVEIFAEQRKMILDAKKTLSVGLRLLKGDDEQLKLVDGAIEFLTEDAARTLGEIQEFNRFSDKMLTDIDISNSANAEMARAKFAEMGTKLEASANRPSAVDQLQAAMNGAGPISIPSSPVVGRGTAASGGQSDNTDYSSLFNK
jgi:septal ring factor EnvC (AmiA/AmiB activator)